MFHFIFCPRSCGYAVFEQIAAAAFEFFGISYNSVTIGITQTEVVVVAYTYMVSFIRCSGPGGVIHVLRGNRRTARQIENRKSHAGVSDICHTRTGKSIAGAVGIFAGVVQPYIQVVSGVLEVAFGIRALDGIGVSKACWVLRTRTSYGRMVLNHHWVLLPTICRSGIA